MINSEQSYEVGYLKCVDVEPVYVDGVLDDLLFTSHKITNSGYILTKTTLKQYLPHNVSIVVLNKIIDHSISKQLH